VRPSDCGVLENESKQPLSRGGAHGDAARGGADTRTWKWVPSTACWWTTRGRRAPRRSCADRAISDYEHELQMALMNRRLCPSVETVFLMSSEAYSFISSRIVKELIRLGGNLTGLVPPSVEVRLRNRVLKASDERMRRTGELARGFRASRYRHMRAAAAAERLRQAGEDVVDLAPGEPDFPRRRTSSRPPSGPLRAISRATRRRAARRS